jgi:hypothetical protein
MLRLVHLGNRCRNQVGVHEQRIKLDQYPSLNTAPAEVSRELQMGQEKKGLVAANRDNPKATGTGHLRSQTVAVLYALQPSLRLHRVSAVDYGWFSGSVWTA